MTFFDRQTIATSLFVLAFGAMTLASSSAWAQIHVDHLATGANNGSSWEDAFTDLQDALAQANVPGGGEIWVARGTYTPTAGTDRTISFLIEFDNVRLYGGFAGTETSREQRDWLANATILSGQIGALGQFDNSQTVLYMDGRTASGTTISNDTVVDGFFITRGNAHSGRIIGGGLLCNGGGSDNECSPRLSNLVIHENLADFAGGGMISLGWDGGKSNPVLTNVVFQSNTAGNGGGLVNMAINNGVSSPVLTNVTFAANEADSGAGGGLYNWADDGGTSNPTLTNVLFAGNRADGQGGGLFNRGGAGGDSGISNPVLINTTFSGNIAQLGGGMGSAGDSNPEVINSVIWNNQGMAFADEVYNSSGAQPEFAFSLIRNSGGSGSGWDSGLGQDGGNNLDADPLFIEPVDPATAPTTLGNLRPQSGSPIINSGLNSAVPSGVNQDLDGNPRILAGTVERGAYEDQPQPVRTYVDQAATGANTGLSWANAFTDLQSALTIAHSLHGRGEIWVARGTYRPTSSSDRTISFRIQNDGIELYGGFAGIETSRETRNWRVNQTILSGDIGFHGANFFANTYHVIYLDGKAINGGRGTALTHRTVIDGFTITLGNASGEEPNDRGAGLFCDGRYLGGECSPILNNLTFVNNRAVITGGAMVLQSAQSERTSSPHLTNVLFSGNLAHFGGAVRLATGFEGKISPIFTNVTFAGNHASAQGGAITNHQGSDSYFEPQIINSILWGNTASNSATNQIANSGGAALTYSHSLIQDSGGSGSGWDSTIGIDGGNNIDANPLFLQPLPADGAPTHGGNYRLQTSSPAIDAGSNTAIPPGIGRDLDANDRINQSIVDMGAYEWYQPPDVIYVDQSANGANTGLSWADAYTDLQTALSDAHNQLGAEIWVAKGIYTPTGGTNRSISFRIAHDDIQIYGGFSGTEINRNERDWFANPTILSGQIGDPETNENNTYHVVHIDGNPSTGANITNSTILDGLIIEDGYADGSGDFLSHMGAGIFCDAREVGSECSPLIENVIVRNNWAYFGAGIVNRAYRGVTNPTMRNISVLGNQASQGCGAFYNATSIGGISSPNVINGLFSGNRSETTPGVICNAGHGEGISSPTFINLTISGNNGGIHNTGHFDGQSFPVIKNSVIFGNSTGHPIRTISNSGNAQPEISYSLIQSSGGSGSNWEESMGIDGGGNIEEDPLFVDPVSYVQTPTDLGNYRTATCSSVMNAGDPSTDLLEFPIWSNGPIDLDANPRVFNSNIDLGAYEVQSAGGELFQVGGTVDGLLGGSLVLQNQAGEILEITQNGPFAFSPQVDCSTYEVTVLQYPQNPIQQCEIDNPTGTVLGADLTNLEVICILDPTETIVYVNQDAIGLDNGSSWEDAFTDLQDALALINQFGQGEVWIAAGTYKPTSSDDRSISFHIGNENVRLYGGFAGHETNRNERDWITNETILSGNIGLESDPIDNSYSVITIDLGLSNPDNAENEVVIDGFTVSDGNADGPLPFRNGAGIRIVDSSVILRNMIITENEAMDHGGGVWSYRSNAQISNATIAHNEADGGGAISSLSGLLELDYVTIKENSSWSNVYIQSQTQSKIRNSRFIANVGIMGAAIDIWGNLSISNSEFLFNESQSIGAAIFAYAAHSVDSQVEIRDSRFLENKGSAGSLIYSSTHAASMNLNIENVLAMNNIASNRGIVWVSSAGNGLHEVTINNSTFAGNISEREGNVLQLLGNSGETSIAMTNNTLAFNHSFEPGSAVYADSGDDHQLNLNIVNSIIWGNTSDGEPRQFDIRGNAHVEISHSLIQDSGGSGENWDWDLGVDGGSNLDADPLFADHAAGNVRLRHGSPAIDAGDNEAVIDIEFDLDGNPRINGSAVDMGAYEWFENIFSDRFEN